MIRLLLRLYSRAFRREFGAEAAADLARELRDTRSAGPLRGRMRAAGVLLSFAGHGLLDRADRIRAAAGDALPGFWNGWTHDVRQALRHVARRPVFTAVAVASVAVGVGANAAVFAVVDTLLLRDIPGVSSPERLVEMQLTLRDGRTTSWNHPDFVDVLRQVDGLEAAAMFERGPVSLAEDDRGTRLLALYVTSGYFRTVGVDPARGRVFGPEVDTGPGAHPVAILSWATWQDRFQGDPDIVGRTIRVNRRPHTVVGVAPDDFRGHQFGLQPALYLPLTEYPPAVQDPERFFGSRGTLWADVIGRVRPGTGAGELGAALSTVMTRLADAHPESNAGRGAVVAPASLMPADGRDAAAVVFALLGTLMLLVLAAASANVGGMLLARASSRDREMAVRLALGSGRARVVRHLVTEAMVVFLLGGAAGVFVAIQGLAWFERASSLPTFLPIRLDFVLDGRVVAFGLLLTAAVGLVFGLLPALGASAHRLGSALREGVESARTGRLRRVFVAGQVGVSVVLLASAAGLLRSLQAGGDVAPGFEPEGVYLTGFDLALEGYGDGAEAAAFLDRLLDHVRAMPDVASAAVAGDFPLDGGSSSSPVWPDGSEAGAIQSYYAHVSDGYFETLGIARRAGRTFGPDDHAGSPLVAVVNEYLADAAWPGENAVGRTVEFGLERRRYEVVGVVADTQTDLITDRPAAQIFTLLAQDPEADLYLAARRRAPDPDFVAAVRAGMLEVDPALALSPTRALADLADLGLLPQRILASIAGALGALALFLSALGVYGVVAFAVARRTREIGVRMALGSSRRAVLGRVLVDGFRLALPGFVVGIALAVALAWALRALLIGVHPLDPSTYAAVAGVFGLVVAAACLAPARRASAVEPSRALRYE